MAITTVAPLDIVASSIWNEVANLLNGADTGVVYNQANLYRYNNSASYSVTAGNVDTTNGLAFKAQYGPVSGPTTIMTAAKAGVTIGSTIPFVANGQTELRGLIAIGDGAAGQTTTMIDQQKQNATASLMMYGVSISNAGTSGIESGAIQAICYDNGHGQLQGINSHIATSMTAATAAHIAAGTGDGWRKHSYESSHAIRLGVASDPGAASWTGPADSRYGSDYVYYNTHFAAITQANPWYLDGAWIVIPPGSATYTLTVTGFGTTAAIAFDANAATIEAAIEALSGMVAANVEVKQFSVAPTYRVILRNLGLSTTLLTGTGATVNYAYQGDMANCVLYAGGTEGAEYLWYDQSVGGGSNSTPYTCFRSQDPSGASGTRHLAFMGIGGIIPTNPFHLYSGYRADDAVMAMIQQVSTTTTPVHLRLTDESNEAEFLALGYNTTSNYGMLQVMDDGTPVSLVLQPAGGKVGVGTASVTGVLHVLGGVAADIVTVIQGRTSQTGDLTQWWNIGGSTMALVTAAGIFGYSNTSGNYNTGAGGAGATLGNVSIDGATGPLGTARVGWMKVNLGGSLAWVPFWQ